MAWHRLALAAAAAAVCLIVVASKDDIGRYIKMRQM
jgi:hypothetical protein